MNNKLFRNYILTICLIASIPISAQRNEIFNSRIATLQVVAGDDWLSPPVTNLNGNPINISFDDLTHDYNRYTYKLEHCEADWTTSEYLFESDYIDGRAVDIDDYNKGLYKFELTANETYFILIQGEIKDCKICSDIKQVSFQHFFK